MLIHEFLEQKSIFGADVISPKATVSEIAEKLSEKKITAFIVMNADEKICGILTERDLVCAIAERPDVFFELQAADIMNVDIVTCVPEDSIFFALEKMNAHNIRHMPIVENDTLLTVIDIRDTQKVCEHLAQLAKTDPLTGLPNRRSFIETMQAEYDRYGRFGVKFSFAMLDIDFFKKVNDTHGHDGGDNVLVRLADIFNQKLRPYDVSARLGGEEFGLLFPNCELEEAIEICEELRLTIEASEMMHDKGIIKWTSSFGVTTVNSQFPDIESMMNYSDELLYEAKKSGRNKVVGKMIVAPDAARQKAEIKTDIDDVFFLQA